MIPPEPPVAESLPSQRRGAGKGAPGFGAGVRTPLSESALEGLSVSFIRGNQAAGNASQSAAWFPVSAGYFRTLGVPLVQGRDFRIQDRAGLPVVLINEAMARRYWPGENSLGQRLRVELPGEVSREIVGVVGNIRHNRYEREVQPQMYVPHFQQLPVAPRGRVESRLTMSFVVRSTADPMRLVPELRTAVTEVDRNLPIFNVRTLDALVAEQLWQPKQTMTLLAIFGAIAVVRAVTGVYGMMAYTVRQRTDEVGIRMALGAGTREVLRLVMGRGLWLSASGVAMGVAGSIGLARFLGTLLWEVAPVDPLTYVVVSVSVAASATLACYLPARRALAIGAADALRCE